MTLLHIVIPIALVILSAADYILYCRLPFPWRTRRWCGGKFPLSGFVLWCILKYRPAEGEGKEY